jgi:two-component system nitrate/nitrite response regulator NarL
VKGDAVEALMNGAATQSGARPGDANVARDKPLRATLAESHACFADALFTTLERSGFDARLADTTLSRSVLVKAILQRRPDVVILGSDLAVDGDRAGLVAPLALAGLAVVVVAGRADDPVRMGMCLLQGATTIVKRTISLERFLAVVRDVARGSFVSQPEEDTLLRSLGEREFAARRELLLRLERLTSSEREILGDLMRGRTAADIAAARFVSQATVRTQIKAVLQKLEVSSQLAAVALAHRGGLNADPRDSPRHP